MNDLLFVGRARRARPPPYPATSFYEDWMSEYYAEYDLERANRMLDEIGLAERDGRTACESISPSGRERRDMDRIARVGVGDADRAPHTVEVAGGPGHTP